MKTDTFITGSSGVLGFETLQHLHGLQGGVVSGVSRRPLPISQPRLPNRIVDSVFDSSWVAPVDKNANIVHFAGLANPRAPFSGFQDLSRREIEPHIKLVETLLARGWCGHFVYVSSGGAVYGDVDSFPISENQAPRPKGYYALQKVSVENALTFLASQHGFRLTILRVSNPYGSHVPKKGQGVIPILLDAAMNGTRFTVIGSGAELRDYIHITDFTRAVQRVLEVEMPDRINTLNIGSGKGTSLINLIGLVMRQTGRSIETTHSDATFDVKSNVLDIARAQRLLDWTPEVALKDGITVMVEDYLALEAQRLAEPGRA